MKTCINGEDLFVQLYVKSADPPPPDPDKQAER